MYIKIISTCCMKPYNIKGAAMPLYAIMAQVMILAQVKLYNGTGQSSCSLWTVTDGEIYLARPILAMPHQLSVHGSTVTKSWRRSKSVFCPSKLRNRIACSVSNAAE